MYVTDLSHYLTPAGTIAPEEGSARTMADFLTAVVAHASDVDRSVDAPGPSCFKCHERDRRFVDAHIAEAGVVVWHCSACGTEGRISNWQGSSWDSSRNVASGSNREGSLRPTTNPPAEDLETFLRRQDAGDLAAVLLELAMAHEAVRERLTRLQLADRPDRLAADFRKTLATWRRSTRYYDYRESGEFARMLEVWLDQVARELLPKDPSAARALFEAFIEADATWFENADDSLGAIGSAVRSACRYWLLAGGRCEASSDDSSERLLKLYEADKYGARDELLRSADRLLDEPALRRLVARFESRLTQMLAVRRQGEHLPFEVLNISGALSLLAESLRDPDIRLRATLRYSPEPNPQQRQTFARDYLDAGRPADALKWLKEDGCNPLEAGRQDLLADTLERLGRFEESSPIRQRMFEQTLSDFDFRHWLEHLPEAARPEALAHARQLALEHRNLAAAATLLLQLGDAAAAESRLLTEPERVDGNFYGSLVPLAKALRDNGCPRGETVIYRALLKAVLERAYARAYGHAARYWARLGQIAASGAVLAPLTPHSEFETEIRQRHGRKPSFWAHVNGSRRDRHEVADDLEP